MTQHYVMRPHPIRWIFIPPITRRDETPWHQDITFKRPNRPFRLSRHTNTHPPPPVIQEWWGLQDQIKGMCVMGQYP